MSNCSKFYFWHPLGSKQSKTDNSRLRFFFCSICFLRTREMPLWSQATKAKSKSSLVSCQADTSPLNSCWAISDNGNWQRKRLCSLWLPAFQHKSLLVCVLHHSSVILQVLPEFSMTCSWIQQQTSFGSRTLTWKMVFYNRCNLYNVNFLCNIWNLINKYGKIMIHFGNDPSSVQWSLYYRWNIGVFFSI